ncbi:MAG: N-formylglutamate amidohydrolase [Myxococcota bacterium]
MSSADPFDLKLAARLTPVVVEVPHAGLEVPAALKGPLVATPRDLRADADLFVDRIYQGAPGRGAPLLCARVSRYVCDLNREPDDVDARAVEGHSDPRPDSPRGFVWRLTTDGKPALARPLTRKEWQKRVDDVWASYHGVLEGLVAEAQAMCGHAILLSGHSMPSVGRALHADSGRPRADIVVGWRGGESCAPRVKDLCVEHFRARGYSVAVDDPYRGGATTIRYGKPGEGVHAVQIEMSRALYMDEQAHAPREQGLSRVRADADALVDALAALDLGR